MSLRFVLSRDAVEDINEVWDYIAEDSLDAADRVMEDFYQAIRKLAATPGMGHKREDLADQRPILFWPVGNYLIIYRVCRLVEIVAVAHGKRDIPAFLRRREA